MNRSQKTTRQPDRNRQKVSRPDVENMPGMNSLKPGQRDYIETGRPMSRRSVCKWDLLWAERGKRK